MPSYKEMKITPPPGVSENDPVPGSYRGVPPSAKTSSVETPYAPFAKQTTTKRRSTPNLPSPPAAFQSGRTATSPLPVSAVDPRRAQALATGTGGFDPTTARGRASDIGIPGPLSQAGMNVARMGLTRRRRDSLLPSLAGGERWGGRKDPHRTGWVPGVGQEPFQRPEYSFAKAPQFPGGQSMDEINRAYYQQLIEKMNQQRGSGQVPLQTGPPTAPGGPTLGQSLAPPPEHPVQRRGGRPGSGRDEVELIIPPFASRRRQLNNTVRDITGAQMSNPEMIRALTGGYVTNEMIRALTGAQMSNREYEQLLRSQLPGTPTRRRGR